MSKENNENIAHVIAAEGLLSQANEHISKVTDDSYEVKAAKDKVFEEINLVQTTTMKELRDICE